MQTFSSGESARDRSAATLEGSTSLLDSRDSVLALKRIRASRQNSYSAESSFSQRVSSGIYGNSEVWGWLQPGRSGLPYVLLQGKGVALGRGKEAYEERLPFFMLGSPPTTPTGALMKCQFSSELLRRREIKERQQPKNSTFIEVADGRVSRLHCWVKRNSDGKPCLQDCSSNGSFLNGEKVPRWGEAPLQDGDRISLVLSVAPLAEQFFTFHSGDPRVQDVEAVSGWIEAAAKAWAATPASTPLGGSPAMGSPRRAQSHAARMSLARSMTSTYATVENTTLDDLQCQICLGTLHNCVALEPCGHNFCAPCLSHHFASLLGSGQPLACPLRCTPPQRVVANCQVRRLVYARTLSSRRRQQEQLQEEEHAEAGHSVKSAGLDRAGMIAKLDPVNSPQQAAKVADSLASPQEEDAAHAAWSEHGGAAGTRKVVAAPAAAAAAMACDDWQEGSQQDSAPPVLGEVGPHAGDSGQESVSSSDMPFEGVPGPPGLYVCGLSERSAVRQQEQAGPAENSATTPGDGRRGHGLQQPGSIGHGSGHMPATPDGADTADSQENSSASPPIALSQPGGEEGYTERADSAWAEGMEEGGEEGGALEMNPLCPLDDAMLPLDAAGLKQRQLSYNVGCLREAQTSEEAMAALEAIARLGWSDDAIREEIAELGGIESIIACMQRWLEHDGVQCNGCLALMALVRGEGDVSNSNKWRVARSDGVECILAALRVHQDQPMVQLSVLVCLVPLALEHTYLQVHICDLALPDLLLAIRNHPDEVEVVGKALVALGVLGQGDEEIHDVIRNQIVRAGAPRLISQVLQTLGCVSEEVLWAALFTLAVVVRESSRWYVEHMVALAAAGVLPALRTAMAAYMADVEAQEAEADEMIVKAGEFLMESLEKAEQLLWIRRQRRMYLFLAVAATSIICYKEIRKLKPSWHKFRQLWRDR